MLFLVLFKNYSMIEKKIYDLIVKCEVVSSELSLLKKELTILKDDLTSKSSTAIFDFIDRGISPSNNLKDFVKTSYLRDFLNSVHGSTLTTTAIGKRLVSNGFIPRQRVISSFNQKGYNIYFKNAKDKFDFDDFLKEKYS